MTAIVVLVVAFLIGASLGLGVGLVCMRWLFSPILGEVIETGVQLLAMFVMIAAFIATAIGGGILTFYVAAQLIALGASGTHRKKGHH